MFIVRNIAKSIAGQKLIDGLSLQFTPQSITAVIGPSGGGKTTLLRALSLLEPPESGAISIDGQDYGFPLSGPLNPPPWPKLSVVFQQLFLWPHLTLRQNMLLPVQNNFSASRQALFAELIESFSLAEFIDRYPAETSGGQKQRIALARAILLQPRYLLLDEITSALDVEQISKILEYLQNLRDRGTGIFLVTHHLNFAKRAADQILFMENGNITEQGNASILQTPKTARLQNFITHFVKAS